MDNVKSVHHSRKYILIKNRVLLHNVQTGSSLRPLDNALLALPTKLQMKHRPDVSSLFVVRELGFISMVLASTAMHIPNLLSIKNPVKPQLVDLMK